ncbi:hypothetical protein LJR066_004452 [Acidovorax sp. LjRoot66]|uniref:hypothetical protein n=1 Tax=Acidovorax sp. LjRoot66 TaxID=3342334 RepID=UPI003ECC3C6E
MKLSNPPLPKAVFAGRLCRIRLEGGIDEVLQRIAGNREPARLNDISGTKWKSFWISFPRALSSGDEPDEYGNFIYPFLCRVSDDRYIIASTDSNFVNFLIEFAEIENLVDSPRVLVDRAARDLVLPPLDENGKSLGRRYTLGAVYGAVEGYARALRNVSFFGDDIAEAELFRYSLNQISVNRLTLRDPNVDKEVMSINATGGLDFHFRNPAQLNLLDALTGFFRNNQYIEWRRGRTWEPQ